MKILVIISTLQRGGAERVVSRLTDVWQKSDEALIAVFDALEIAYTYGGTLVDLKCSAANGIWGKIINSFRRIFKLAALIRKEKPDHIISFMESANFPAILAASFTGTLTCLTVSVRDDPERFILPYRCLISCLYRFPKRVVAVSQGVSLALEKMNIPKKKLFFIPNPAPCKLHEIENKNEETVHLAPPRYILGVGRLHPQKGFDRLMAAFAGIDDPDLHLVILGEGKERAKLETLAEELKISARVMLPGVVNNIAPWYKNALCYVLSSRHEGWPNVLMEAMYWRCPVIAFNCRYGVNEIIESEVSGLLVPEGDICALQVAIVKIIENDLLREKFVKESLRKLEQFDVNNIAKIWLD
jgi:glycosyltransferase involved in cell wall biosynthesis